MSFLFYYYCKSIYIFFGPGICCFFSVKLSYFRWNLFCCRSQHCSISQFTGKNYPDPDLFPVRVRFLFPVHQNIQKFRFRSAWIFQNSRLINLSSKKIKLIENRTIFIKLSCFRWTLFCWRSQHCSISQFSGKNCCPTWIRIYFRVRSDFCSWSTRIFESSGLPNLPSTLQSGSLRIVRILFA